MNARSPLVIVVYSVALIACTQTQPSSVNPDAQKVQSIAEDIERKGDDATALAIYNRALELAPNDQAVLVKVGDLHQRNRRFRDAADAYRRAVAINPSNPDALIGLGNAQISAGDEADGKATLTRAAAVAQTASSLNRLGVAQTQAGQFAQAVTSYRKALASNQDADTAANLALAMSLAGQNDEAINLMQKIATVPAATDRHKANLALVLAIAGREDDARKALPETFPRSDAQSLLATARKVRAAKSDRDRGRVLSVLSGA